MTTQKLIQQGAEAKILLSKDFIIKDRISKGYRHPDLDKKIIKRRTKSETKILSKASEIINSPKPITTIDFNKIKMPYVNGKKLSEHLEKLNHKTICKQIANQIATLHDNDLIHGDLTTSNMILDKNNNLFFIDFGLGYHSHKIEDKAVDLHLIRQALEAKHHKIYNECWKTIQQNYSSKDKGLVLAQLEKVEARGRYKKGH